MKLRLNLHTSQPFMFLPNRLQFQSLKNQRNLHLNQPQIKKSLSSHSKKT